MPSLTDAWARQLTAWEEIPGPFRPFVPADRPLPYLIYSPPDAWGSRRVNARLTMLSDRGISVLETTTDGVRVSTWLFVGLDYVEQGAVHLYSWLRFGGGATSGPATAQVEYNAVVAPLFAEVVATVRRSWVGMGSALLAEEQVKLADLAAADYKFGNYARESVLPGEQVLAMVYQPEITVPHFLFSRRRLTAPYVVILTDRELILISDDCSGGDTGRYGVVRRYIPLTKIKDWQLESAACDKTGVWQLELPGETVVLHFSVPAQSALLVLAPLLDAARGNGAGLLGRKKRG